MLIEPRCSLRACKHFLGVGDLPGTPPPGPDAELLGGGEAGECVICEAFPEGIPASIAYGHDPHTKPVEGDKGIQFEQGDRQVRGWYDEAGEWQGEEDFVAAQEREMREEEEETGVEPEPK